MLNPNPNPQGLRGLQAQRLPGCIHCRRLAGGLQEACRRLAGGLQEACRRHAGGLQEACARPCLHELCWGACLQEQSLHRVLYSLGRERRCFRRLFRIAAFHGWHPGQLANWTLQGACMQGGDVHSVDCAQLTWGCMQAGCTEDWLTLLLLRCTGSVWLQVGVNVCRV
jgi:hypothetical protein